MKRDENVEMMVINRIEKIRNKGIRTRADVANIGEYIRDVSLRLLWHMERKTGEDVVMRTLNMEVGEHRHIGRPIQ